MIDKKIEKPTMKIDLQKIKSFLDTAKKSLGGLYSFFRDNKNNSKIMLLIALITSGLAIYFAIQLYTDISYLNAQSSDLYKLSRYDVRTLETDTLTNPILKSSDTIKDILQENKFTQ
jgi:hypothetical protein